MHDIINAINEIAQAIILSDSFILKMLMNFDYQLESLAFLFDRYTRLLSLSWSTEDNMKFNEID